MTYILIRLNVGDFDIWKQMFDDDDSGIRAKAKGHRVLRGVEDADQVIVVVEFDSSGDAITARDKLLASGILAHFPDKDLPIVVEESETVVY